MERARALRPIAQSLRTLRPFDSGFLKFSPFPPAVLRGTVHIPSPPTHSALPVRMVLSFFFFSPRENPAKYHQDRTTAFFYHSPPPLVVFDQSEESVRVPPPLLSSKRISAVFFSFSHNRQGCSCLQCPFGFLITLTCLRKRY